MKRIWPLIPLALFLILAVIAGVSLMNGGTKPGPSQDGMTGQPAPAYALERLDGAGQVTPADFAGKAYVVNFFASWCAPCRVEHPLLRDLAEEGVPILGVAYKDKPDATRGMLSELGDPFAVTALDPSGRLGLEFGIAGVPETFVIGADGAILALHRGPLDKRVIETKIKPALER